MPRGVFVIVFSPCIVTRRERGGERDLRTEPSGIVGVTGEKEKKSGEDNALGLRGLRGHTH